MVEGGGGGEKKKQRFLLPPLPRHSFFFCSRPNVLDELARKRLLHRLNLNSMVVLSKACKTFPFIKNVLLYQADDHIRIQKSHLHDTVSRMQNHPRHTNKIYSLVCFLSV